MTDPNSAHTEPAAPEYAGQPQPLVYDWQVLKEGDLTPQFAPGDVITNILDERELTAIDGVIEHSLRVALPTGTPWVKTIHSTALNLDDLRRREHYFSGIDNLRIAILPPDEHALASMRDVIPGTPALMIIVAGDMKPTGTRHGTLTKTRTYAVTRDHNPRGTDALMVRRYTNKLTRREQQRLTDHAAQLGHTAVAHALEPGVTLQPSPMEMLPPGE